MSVRPLRGSPVVRVGDVRRRRWSESPIPRPGVRRVRATGQLAPVLVGDPENYATLTAGGSTSYTLSLSAGVGAGDFVLAVMCALGATWSPPAGWTTLRSGTVTDLSYWIGWRELDGSDSLTFTRSNNSDIAMVDFLELRNVASVSATAVSEVTGVTSITLPVPASASPGARSIQIVLYKDGDVTNGLIGINPSDGSSPGDPLSDYGVTGTYSTWRFYAKRSGIVGYSPDRVLGKAMGTPLLRDPFWSLHPGTFGVVNTSTSTLETITEVASCLVTVTP